jgi:hypothetical protein
MSDEPNGLTTRHDFVVLDFSRLRTDKSEMDLEVNGEILDEFAASGWKVISLVPHTSQKPNQFLALLTRD